MQIDWSSIRSGQADALHDAIVELSGWMIPLELEPCVDYFLLAADAPCCSGCEPTFRLRTDGSAVEHRSHWCFIDSGAGRPDDDSRTTAPSGQ